MKGREENELIVEKKISSIIFGKPEILQDYTSSGFINKSYTTKNVYVGYVIDFLNYLEVNHIINTFDVGQYNLITMRTIDNYAQTLKNSKNKTGRNKEGIQASRLYAIFHFFKFLYSRGIVTTNPCVGISVPKVREEIEVISLTGDEVRLIKENIEKGVGTKKAIDSQKKWRNRDLALLQLGLTTGLRVTAMSEINLEDIDFENKVIRVTDKGNVTKNSYIGDQTIEVLRAWIKDRKKILGNQEMDALFVSNQKKRISTKAIGYVLNKYTQNIDKHITPHKLRSSCATNLYAANGGDIYEVGEVLGHKNLSNTKRYTKISEEKRKSAASKLDNIF